jgi:murein DD-endopeptidase MepM/ murein hydrolase activator NlpD
MAGVVRSAGPRGGYGNAVEIDHGNGVTTLYGHASELLVQPGQLVHAGEEIARVGSTGRSTGAHLHFEVRVGGRAVDPSKVLKAYASRAEDDRRSGP